MQVVSFSLFGSAPQYTQGAVKNALLYPKLLPGWRVVMFCGPDVPRDVLLKLKQAGADVRGPVAAFANRMFDRFTILDDPAVERAIIRDTDSRPSQREAAALREWLESGKPFHSMGDQPHHHLPLGGGLWGVDFTKFKGEPPHLLRHVTEAIVKSRLAKRPYKREDSYGLDQTFLTHFIWPLARQHGVLRHDSCNRHIFTDAVPFPTAGGFGDLNFVGEVMGANDEPNWNHRTQRLNFIGQ